MADIKTSLSAGYILYHILTEDEAVSRITSDVFPGYKDKAPLPYIYYQRTGMETQPVKAGRPSDSVEVQVTCLAETYDESLELAEAVRNALDGVAGTANGLTMRSCVLVDSQEGWAADAYIQHLIFNLKIY